MAANRLFLSQETLDDWIEKGRAEVHGQLMILKPTGHQLIHKTALLFKAEVGSGEDPYDVVGRVKDLDQLEPLGGEHCAGSVIIGDSAYEVVEGLIGEPIGTFLSEGPTDQEA